MQIVQSMLVVKYQIQFFLQIIPVLVFIVLFAPTLSVSSHFVFVIPLLYKKKMNSRISEKYIIHS